MSHSMTIETWMTLEKPAFDQFPDYVALRLEDGILRSLAECMRRQIQRDGKASVTLPWGTFTAEPITVGEGTNITPAFTPSKAFMKMLNDDEGRDMRQETFDPEFEKLFKDYVAWGYFDPDTTNDDNTPARDKGMRLHPEEVEYFLNNYMQVLVNIARDKQRDGKTYRLEINEIFPHGAYDFTYEDDKIEVKFIANKVFKQYLKDDDIAAKAATADFSGKAANMLLGLDKPSKKVKKAMSGKLDWNLKWRKKPDWMH